MLKYSEEEIIEQLRDQRTQRNAFEKIVAVFSEQLYWYIRRMVISHEDANDILQNTFIKAWSNIGNFRGEAKISTWLFRIAINECITFLNKQKQLQGLSIDDVDSSLLGQLEAPDNFIGNEVQKKLQEAVLRLPDKQRTVFNLKYFQEMKYEEMSELLNTSVGALKASYHHAVKKIEDYILGEN